MISRRRFLTTTGAAVLAAPLVVEAQATKVMRIGWLWDGSVGPPLPGLREAFWQALQERGWVEGRNFVIESRSAENRGLTNEQRDEVLKRLAAELVASHVDVIVAFPAGAALAAKKVTEVVPIVFTGVSDPVSFGLVASLARPGGNVTGLSYLGLELNPKRLHLLKEAFPKATRIGVLVPALHPLRQRMVKDIEAAAQALNVRLHFMVVAASDPPDHIDRAFAAMAHERVDAVLGLQGPHYFRERRRIADLALKHKLPGIFELAAYAEAGCLMAYAPSFSDLYRRAATYVDKILKGTKPADLPVEQPTTFELVINRASREG